VTSAPWRLVVSGPAARDLEGLPEKAAAAVVESFQAIAADPRRVGKPLRFELEGLWSARRGPYRVIYRIDEAERVVVVVAVGHRASVYRRR
jgi:mRNA-degrading endonuclease RelE of RelBE toxin-antitoxin system